MQIKLQEAELKLSDLDTRFRVLDESNIAAGRCRTAARDAEAVSRRRLQAVTSELSVARVLCFAAAKLLCKFG